MANATMKKAEATTSSKPFKARSVDRGSLKSMQKLMAVLDCFSVYEQSLTLNEIAVRCDIPKTTAHRLVSSLREAKLLEQDHERDRYRMGIRLFELGSIVLANLDIFTRARHLAQRLNSATGEGGHLCVFDGTNVISVEHIEPDNSRVNWTTLLSISPAYCTGVGKAVLAFQDIVAIAKIIRGGLRPFTPMTITDPDRLMAELELTKQRGYAIDNGEHQPNVRCIAAPIRNVTGRVYAAISVSGPIVRMTDDKLAVVRSLLIATADEISRLSGYTGSPST
jgi:DNA-binding IclR family transcriptional regulator